MKTAAFQGENTVVLESLTARLHSENSLLPFPPFHPHPPPHPCTPLPAISLQSLTPCPQRGLRIESETSPSSSRSLGSIPSLYLLLPAVCTGPGTLDEGKSTPRPLSLCPSTRMTRPVLSNQSMQSTDGSGFLYQEGCNYSLLSTSVSLLTILYPRQACFIDCP